MRERFQKMSPEERAQARTGWMAMRGAGGPGEGRPEGLAGPRPDAARAREGEWQIVWKLDSKNSLQPVRVKTGITDYTFTAMLEGEHKPGEKLLIGQTSRQRQQMPGGMGRMPGRF
jgi:hypothetical protein